MPLQSDQNNGWVKKPRILVVDDDQNIRRAMHFILGAELEVTVAESGDEACERIEQGMEFDVVSLDLQMPGMSGIDTLKAIRKISPTTEVLIVTAHSGLESAIEALKLGAYDYIGKPFESETFREAVRKGIERRIKTKVSEKTQEHLAFVKAQLKQSEKFAALGQLIAGVVHELNNPLHAVIGFSDLLLTSDYSPEKARSYLAKINEGAQLCKSITNKFLAFTRNQEKKREHIDISSVIESTVELRGHDFKRDHIEVIMELEDNLPGTVADYHELQQVFLNMINNAQQAMKGHRGSKTLTVRSASDDETIRISFQDTGPGIPKENLLKIFEPLFTTKPMGEGTGLGLSISYEIIKEHGGDIFVAIEPGKGACFVIEIPIVAQTSETAASSEERDREVGD